MKFYCCGLIYDTKDPETYWCIETHHLKTPVDNILGGKKIAKQIVYVLCCKVHGCLKLEIHSFEKDKVTGKLKLVMTQAIKGSGALRFLERTKDMRIRQSQNYPLKAVPISNSNAWVYGKAYGQDKQKIQYIDESGARQVFKKNKWTPEILVSPVRHYFI